LEHDDAIRATAGTSAAYFSYPVRPGLIQATAYFADAVKRAGLKAVVNLSQISAREDSKSYAARDHWIAERVLDWSGVPVVHLRPTFFAQWLLYRFSRATIVEDGIIDLPYGEGRHAPIAAEDQARLIAAILAEPTAHLGKTYTLHGPTELGQAGIAAAVSEVLGRKISYRPLTIPSITSVWRRPVCRSSWSSISARLRSIIRYNLLGPTLIGAIAAGVTAAQEAGSRSWLRAIRRSDLADDPRFATAAACRANFAELHRIVQNWILTFHDIGALDAQLDEAKIAFGEVRSLKQLSEIEWAEYWGAVQEVSDRHGGSYLLPGRPWRFAREQLAPLGEPAFQGDHNRAVLAELGFSGDKIDACVVSGALVSASIPEPANQRNAL
jgi:uncharacterized protein YbjT (DUF2867 family)